MKMFFRYFAVLRLFVLFAVVEVTLQDDGIKLPSSDFEQKLLKDAKRMFSTECLEQIVQLCDKLPDTPEKILKCARTYVRSNMRRCLNRKAPDFRK